MLSNHSDHKNGIFFGGGSDSQYFSCNISAKILRRTLFVRIQKTTLVIWFIKLFTKVYSLVQFDFIYINSTVIFWPFAHCSPNARHESILMSHLSVRGMACLRSCECLNSGNERIQLVCIQGTNDRAYLNTWD